MAISEASRQKQIPSSQSVSQLVSSLIYRGSMPHHTEREFLRR
jgi:hypothetical protein